MSSWSRKKAAALGLYYYASIPLRRSWNFIMAQRGQLPIGILFFHRVAQEADNAWTISNRRFEHHIQWLARHFEIISLSEAQRRLRQRASYRAALAITFDDGYADNCEFALPLLIKHRIPCTYFVSSRNVLEGRPFPHDLKARAPLRPNTIDQIRALAASGVEIGAHTQSHVDLGEVVDTAELKAEIAGSREKLESIIDAPVRYFAAPFGFPANIPDKAIELIQAARYDGYCSAFGGYNLPGRDAFHLRRFHGDPEFIRLKNWVTIDPRKRYAGEAIMLSAVSNTPPRPTTIS